MWNLAAGAMGGYGLHTAGKHVKDGKHKKGGKHKKEGKHKHGKLGKKHKKK
jgi:hypothetical protein